MSDLFVSIMDPCQDCDQLSLEKRELKDRLQVYEELLKDLQKFDSQFEGLKILAGQYGIDAKELANGFMYALDKMFAIKSKAIVEKGKTIVELIMELSKRSSEINKLERVKQSVLPKKRQMAQVKNASEIPQKKNQDYPKEPAKRKKEEQVPASFEERRTQKVQYPRKDNEFNKREEKYENPYLPKQETTQRKKQKYANSDEEEQSRAKGAKNNIYEDINLPLVWNETRAFSFYGKVITKLDNDDYSKMSTSTPLPNSGTHKIKFQVMNSGTFAIGIVQQSALRGKFVDDKKGAVKYLSFDNGGGLLKFCGDEIQSGRKVHVNEGQILEVTYNSDIREVKFDNPNLDQPIVISLNEMFKNKNLYFFIEMKHKNTAVKMI